MPEWKPTLAQVLRAGLSRPPERPQAEPSAYESLLKRKLQVFQVDLLLAEYQDFASQPRYRSLVQFFFGAIYAPRDFGLRNESFRSLHRWLVGLVGPAPVRVLSSAIDLYELTESLDDDMVLALRLAGAQEISGLAIWETAYRAVGRRFDRLHQLDMLLEAGEVLESAAHVPFVHLQLRAVRPAVGLLGWGHVVDFLLQGQEAVVAASPLDPLLKAIRARELARINRLLGPGPRAQ